MLTDLTSPVKLQTFNLSTCFCCVNFLTSLVLQTSSYILQVLVIYRKKDLKPGVLTDLIVVKTTLKP